MADYSPAHERANVLTHLFGFGFGLVALPLLVWTVVKNSPTSTFDVLGSVAYGFGFLMVFGFSTLYHYQGQPERKYLMKIWDHISIYYMIAGTYTPYLIWYADPPDARLMLFVLWGLAAAGTVFKVFFTGKFRLVSTLIYLVMGWLIVAAPQSFKDNLPDNQIFWIALGGAFYSLGVVFYLFRRIPFHHAIWHVFVLGGAVSHYIGIWKMYG